MKIHPDTFIEGKAYTLSFTPALVEEEGDISGDYIFRGTEFSAAYNGGYRFVFSHGKTRFYLFPHDLEGWALRSEAPKPEDVPLTIPDRMREITKDYQGHFHIPYCTASPEGERYCAKDTPNASHAINAIADELDALDHITSDLIVVSECNAE